MTQTDSYMMRCNNCGTKNRIPTDKIGSVAKCGKCRAPINTDELAIEKPVIVTDDDFEANVLKASLPVLLDCWAPWCGPCKMIGPVMDELAGEWKGRIKICKLNTDENPVISTKYQINSIPTMLIFDNGQLKDTLVGALPKQHIVQKMTPYL